MSRKKPMAKRHKAKKPPKRKQPKKSTRVTGPTLTHILYAYLEPRAFKAAATKAKSPRYGTVSGYINILICRDNRMKLPTGLKGQTIKRSPKHKRAKKTVAKLRAVKPATSALAQPTAQAA